jgi:hypothetical protein
VGVPKNLARSRAVVGLSAPLGVGIVLALGLVICKSFNIGYRGEMWAAAIVSLVAGTIAVLPLLILMHRGLIVIVRMTMAATAIRVVVMVVGMYLAMGPGWKLSLMPLVVWTMGCYFAMLIAESLATAWVVRHG